MSRYWRVIGHYNAETQAYSACVGTFQSSPFTPDVDGRLVGIRLMEGHEAATSLTCDVQIRISCAIWKPNTMDFNINGHGIMTAPAFPGNVVDFAVDQSVRAGVPITVEGRHNTATGVTTSIVVLGCFEA